ncbi:MAG: RES family NAD+ phosphorylase [Dehalococcoidia bacterium]|nr:RES family NAD+ phosphorylase [Dehalococcoidia bacterium]
MRKSLTLRPRKKAVWTEIDNAFSRPVEISENLADYVPTQILSELFRDAGYDAIIYRSNFGEEGYNIAVFSPDDAEILNCGAYEVTRIEVKFREAGNLWHSR